MRLLIISQYFWPEPFRVNDLAVAFRERGHDVTVLTGMPNYPSGSFFPGYGIFRRWRERLDGVDIVRVPLIPRGRGGGVRLALNYLSFAIMASLMAPFRCRGAFDAIFVHEPSPITVAFPAIVMKRLKRIPIYFWVLDLWPESLAAAGGVRSLRMLNLVGRMVRFIYRQCDKVLVQSRRFVGPVQDHGVKSDDILYFPSWAEAFYRPLAKPAAFRREFGLPAGFLLMFAGNIGSAQDFEAVLAAAEMLKEHRDIHWLVVGDGRKAGWVRDQISAKGLDATVHMLGRHAAERMPEFFAAADAMLVSLKSEPIFSMTIPAKVQSYLACGRPVLAMLDGEGGKVVEESGAGFACASGDASALAEAVLRMETLPPEERERMGARGRRYYEEHFDRDMLFSQLESWMTSAGIDGGITADG